MFDVKHYGGLILNYVLNYNVKSTHKHKTNKMYLKMAKKNLKSLVWTYLYIMSHIFKICNV